MNSGERLRATFELKPVDHLYRKEFYIWDEAIAKWKNEGLPDDYIEQNLFNYDDPGEITVGQDLGWCEPPFFPYFEEKLITSECNTEIIQDVAGRYLRVFKGRRHGFMPEYVKHPVETRKDWEENVLPRLDPKAENRYETLEERCKKADKERSEKNLVVKQGFIGGYMYLRALMGPEGILYAVHDDPELVHDMMKQWFSVMDTAIEKIQNIIPLDLIELAEDICYKQGLLISPDMVREFLLPYYQELVLKAKARQKIRLFLNVDTDGFADPAIPLYLEAGMNIMDPFEVASNCDVVRTGKEYPNLVMTGGIDKRILAASKEAIDKHLDYIMPAMVKRGGYIPTCDHGVPDNVSLENYLYYRKRICEMDH